MPSSTPNPKTNPAIELLLAYDEADLMAAVHFQALRNQDYPLCLCQSGARNEFKRRYRKLLGYSVTTATSPPAQAPRPPHPLRFWRTALVCFALAPFAWWAIIKGFQLLHF